MSDEAIAAQARAALRRLNAKPGTCGSCAVAVPKQDQDGGAYVYCARYECNCWCDERCTKHRPWNEP